MVMHTTNMFEVDRVKVVDCRVFARKNDFPRPKSKMATSRHLGLRFSQNSNLSFNGYTHYIQVWRSFAKNCGLYCVHKEIESHQPKSKMATTRPSWVWFSQIRTFLRFNSYTHYIQVWSQTFKIVDLERYQESWWINRQMRTMPHVRLGGYSINPLDLLPSRLKIT